MNLPVLRLGSIGSAVKTLQSALNAWPLALPPQLAVDGVFGPKTDKRVREYQSGEDLGVDGVVGPETWASLQPLVEAMLGQVPLPKSDLDAGERIAMNARAAWGWFGWGDTGPVVPSKASVRVAAAMCADETDPLRPRQGAVTLVSIFQLAGASGRHVLQCPSISVEAVAKWQMAGQEATQWRNAHDLPAWCGIFCYYVYRLAGIPLGGWVNHGTNVHGNRDRNIKPKFRQVGPANQVFRGCIGVVDGIRGGGRNHHFIVIDNDVAGRTLHTIDGNAHGPVNKDYAPPLKSVIARKTYSYDELKRDQAYFLFPDFAKGF